VERIAASLRGRQDYSECARSPDRLRRPWASSPRSQEDDVNETSDRPWLPRQTRRSFLRLGGAAAAVTASRAVATAAHDGVVEGPAPAPAPPEILNPATAGAMPTRNLGRLGFKVGIFALGGQSALERPDNHAEAVPVIERALDLGVNYIDTSSIYGGPERWSEQYIGQVMKRRRREAFLASKTKERTRDGSLRMLEKSLALLQTDHLDCWQLHDIGTMGDVDEVFARSGAMEALIRAREEGVVKHLGITGHFRPDCLVEAIRRHPFDTVLLAVNAAERFHFSFEETLIPLAVEKQMGIIAMKLTGRQRILASYVPPPAEAQRQSWEGSAVVATRPGTLTMRDAMYYALTLPVSTAIVGIDNVAQLEENVRLAREFTPLTRAQMDTIAGKAESVARQAMFYKFFDRA
jgi:aryl-alcohol dehydrogenase-like predicted oxidoreductase